MMNERTIAVPVTEYIELIKARVERDYILESYEKDTYPSLTDKIIELIKEKNSTAEVIREVGKDA